MSRRHRKNKSACSGKRRSGALRASADGPIGARESERSRLDEPDIGSADPEVLRPEINAVAKEVLALAENVQRADFEHAEPDEEVRATLATLLLAGLESMQRLAEIGTRAGMAQWKIGSVAFELARIFVMWREAVAPALAFARKLDVFESRTPAFIEMAEFADSLRSGPSASDAPAVPAQSNRHVAALTHFHLNNPDAPGLPSSGSATDSRVAARLLRRFPKEVRPLPRHDRKRLAQAMLMSAEDLKRWTS